jgi:hypothetical protein
MQFWYRVIRIPHIFNIITVLTQDWEILLLSFYVNAKFNLIDNTKVRLSLPL